MKTSTNKIAQARLDRLAEMKAVGIKVDTRTLAQRQYAEEVSRKRVKNTVARGAKLEAVKAAAAKFRANNR